MTLETECRLSFYKELAVINEEKNIKLVRQVESGELFALKELSVYDISVYERLKEARPEGIAGIHDFIEDDGILYVIEEYVQGKNLQQIYDEGGCISEDQAVTFFEKLCDILKKLHDMEPPVIHRDIKPSNIILTRDGVIKLIDFNAAKNVSKGESTDTRLLGTRNFAAPEQYGFGSSDVRTDIYGLAATINYLMTGKYPNEEIAAGKLGGVLKKALRLEPEERYASVEEMLEALQGGSHFNRKKHPGIYKYKAFLPVGYRSGQLLSMCLATIIYLAIIFFNFPWGDDPEDVYIGNSDLIDSIIWTLLHLMVVQWLGNYMNIRHRLMRIEEDDIFTYIEAVLIATGVCIIVFSYYIFMG